MAPLAPSSELVERFRAGLERLTGAAPEQLGLAVSGGPDSLALLLLAQAAYGNKVEAVTIDHGLRAGSAEEAEFVGEVCARLGVPHSILAVEVPAGGEGLQGEARRARYRALRQWAVERGINALATAHHADDQAETVLMRLQRGSGLGGLAGVRAVRREGDLCVVRPLLDWTKAELAGVVAEAGIEAVEDPSNMDMRFDRAAMRRFLADNPQFEAARLARSARALAEAGEAIEWTADLLEAERCSSDGREWRIDASGLPRELRRRLLGRAIAAVRRVHGLQPDWSGSEDVEGLLTALEGGVTGTRAGVMASADGDIWRIRPAPPRRQTR